MIVILHDMSWFNRYLPADVPACSQKDVGSEPNGTGCAVSSWWLLRRIAQTIALFCLLGLEVFGPGSGDDVVA